jgi:trehalose 6-phosphate phosphatase
MTERAVADQILEVLSHRPAGLFSDFDGVLSEIAPTPSSAFAYPGAEDAFRAISRHLDVAGVITGRAVDDVAQMISIDDLIVVGNHGLEWWEMGDRHDHEAGTRAVAAISRVMDQARNELSGQADITGMIWENKRLSATIHVRNTADPAAMEALLLPVVVPLAEENDLRCTPGKMIVEIRPRALVTKGTAINTLFETRNLMSAVYIGDDVTDVDGFRALREQRALGKHTLAVGVATPDAHPDVLEHADEVVGSVDEIVEVLKLVAAGLEREA